MTSILNVAIGLVFVFLLVSLVVSALNELWLSWLDKRADFLKEGLRELLQDPNRIAGLLDHGLVDALSRKTNGNPSYIGSEPFTAAVLDLIKPADPTMTRTIDNFRDAITALPPGKFKQSLCAILDEANNDLAAFKHGIASWYDRSMARVSGWYKRYAQQWLFALGLFLAVACNIDTIHIIGALSTDPKLATATAEEATAFLSAQKSSVPATTPSAAPNQTGAPAATATPSLTPRDLVNNVQSTLSNLNGLRVPIGWDASERAYFCGGGPHWGHIFSALFGWLVTALAASLGAPFWFDTLQRFVNIRGNGRAPDEKDPTKAPTTTPGNVPA